MDLTATKVMVVCPVCMGQHFYPLSPGYSRNLICPNKKKAFDVLFAKTRAKNQHSQSRNSRIKVYQMRFILPNKTEELVRFQSHAQHFELRAGDRALVAYYNGGPKIVQNCTVNQYMSFAEGCFVATAVYGSYEADEVLLLRAFRDRELAVSRLGRMLICLYYVVSPSLVEFLEAFPFAKKPAKYLLDRLVKAVKAE